MTATKYWPGGRFESGQLPWIRRNSILFPVMALAALLAWAGPAKAAVISLIPSEGTIQVGDSFNLDVVVGELPYGEIVSAFDLDLLVDASVLAYTGISFGSMFGTEPLLAVASDFGGFVNFALIADILFSDDALFGLQGGGPVLLATLSFRGIAAGMSSLFIDQTFPIIGGRDAALLEISDFGSARVSVERVQSVPETGTLGLMLTGLMLTGLGKLGLRARRRSSA